jgi:NAD(P)-dependent dehydrogenase (short-subunit alcohol dehydrogenase family)
MWDTFQRRCTTQPSPSMATGGTGRPMPFEQVTEEDWRSSIDNNLTSTFFTLKCFLPAEAGTRAASLSFLRVSEHADDAEGA